MEGWIKLHRNLLNWEWFSEPKTLAIFVYFLLSARHNEGSWRGINLKAGELITSRESISNATGLSVQEVRTAMGKLVTTGEITTKATTKYTIVTINNYESYQSVESDNQPTEKPTRKQTSNKETTNEQPTNNHKQECNTTNNVSTTRNIGETPNIPLKGFSIKDRLISDGVPEGVVDAYMKVRKTKKAPDTEVAYKGLIREAEKAGLPISAVIQECVERNWVGFKAEWIKKTPAKSETPTIFENQESDWVRQRREQEERERKEFNQRMFEENKKRINGKK